MTNIFFAYKECLYKGSGIESMFTVDPLFENGQRSGAF